MSSLVLDEGPGHSSSTAVTPFPVPRYEGDTSTADFRPETEALVPVPRCLAVRSGMFAVGGTGQATPAIRSNPLLLTDISETGRYRRVHLNGKQVMGYLSSRPPAGFLVPGATDPAMQAIGVVAE
jgi:hypothetical protein